MMLTSSIRVISGTGLLLAGVALFAGPANADCDDLPTHAQLQDALEDALDFNSDGGGLQNDMWATIVDRDGIVCSVAFSGGDRGDQWPASRVISAQKANTANSLSLPPGAGGEIPGLALATANLYAAVQPGGSLFGLQESNPVSTAVAYGGDAANYGQPNDPMVGGKIGGVNVFGGGLALYNAPPGADLLGAVGVSGDTSCSDHNVAWKVRYFLNLDNVPAGVSPTGDDNIIYDADGIFTGFEHPECGFGEEAESATLPTDFPLGPQQPKCSGGGADPC